jgi:hypothetical protein
VTARPGGILVRPDVASQQINEEAKKVEPAAGDDAAPESGASTSGGAPASTSGSGGTSKIVAHPTSFYGQFSLDSVRAIRQLEDILRNVVEHLSSADGSSVDLTLEINAKSSGFDDRTRRVVSENANQLGAKGQEFE